MKLSGKRSAGNSHAAFDEAGDGNGDKETTAHCSTLLGKSALDAVGVAREMLEK